jgi:hypothetical protein
MELYPELSLENFQNKAPFFTHPYEKWKTDAPDINLELEKFADEMKDQKGFCTRLRKAQAETNDITSFFPFLTELKLAKFLRQYNSIELIQTRNQPTPDLKLDNGIYVEINAALGQFFEIDYIQSNLQEIDARFRFWGRWGLKPFLEDEIPFSWLDLIPKFKAEISKWKGKQLPSNPYTFWGDRKKHNLFAELFDKNIDRDPDPDNANGRPDVIVPISIRDRINSKIKEDTKLPANGLSIHHPNVIWFELAYSSYEFLNADWSKFDYTKIILPVGIDSVVFSVCEINSGYDDLMFAHLLFNEEIDSKNKLIIQNWADKLWQHW